MEYLESNLDLQKEMANLEIDEGLVDCAKEIKKMLSDDWDYVIAITGIREGVGKSSLAIILGYMINPKFNLLKNISYLPTHREIEGKFNKLKSKDVLDVDEAIKVFHKHDWMNKFQRRLVEMYATERKQNKATEVLMPRLRDFTENFRNHKIHYNIHLVTRGYAVAFVKDDYNYASQDPWHLKETEKLLEKLRANRRIIEIPLEQRMEYYKKVPNYSHDFVFPKLPEAVFEEYKRIGFELRKNKEIDSRDLNSIRALIDLIHDRHKAGMTYDEMATKTGLPRTTIASWCQRRDREEQEEKKQKIREKQEIVVEG